MKKIISIIAILCCVIMANAQIHPWQGKRVAYFGDSITDPRNSGSTRKYWGFLNDWL